MAKEDDLNLLNFSDPCILSLASVRPTLSHAGWALFPEVLDFEISFHLSIDPDL